ncbi:MAG: two-component regulator propeller domain-containing protein, partial [Lachnospiraceae bacterium]|nr:two-component regulator propeller domain-containing protein [Lachnospiraceae bacterium]
MKKQRIWKNTGWLLLWMLFLAVCACQSVQAETSDHLNMTMEQELYNSQNGLLYTATTDIAQTTDGFIWIGSYGCLMRYDGVEFIRIGEEEGISNITSLAAGKDGIIWFGMENKGLGYYNHGVIKLYTSKNSDLFSDNIQTICLDEEGNVYFGTEQGMGCINLENQISRISPENEKLCGERIRNTIMGNQNLLVCICRDGDLYFQTEDGMELAEAFTDARSVVYEEEQNRYWVGTESGTLCQCDETFQIKKEISLESLETINDIVVLEDEKLFLCADEGTGVYDITSGQFYLQDLVMDDSVDEMMVDLQGNYWLCSSRLGVLKMSVNSFLNIGEVLTSEKSVVNTTAVFENQLLIGCDNGLKVVDMDRWEEIEVAKLKELSGKRIRHILADEDGTLWFCTNGYGLYCL